MNLHSATYKTATIIFATVAILATTVQLRPVFSGESAAAARSLKTKRPGPTTLPAAAGQKAAPESRVRDGHNTPASGTWNRSPSRSPGSWMSSQADSNQKSKIRFASASGMDDGEVSTAETSPSPEETGSTKPADPTLADNADAAAADTNVTAEQTPPSASASVSVKQQLLNAMRMQREAMTNPNALKSPTSSGSLTIMNSPRVTPKPPVESGNLAPPISSAPAPSQFPSSTDQSNLTPEVNELKLQPQTPKSNTGLTRTLEEDLKSNDVYLRERAQRFLRLQMQLQQLRSRQATAADAETVATVAVDHAAKSTANHTDDNSIPVNPAESDPATHSLSPSSDVLSGDVRSGNHDGANQSHDTEQPLSHENTATQQLHSNHPPTSDQQTQPEAHIDHEATSEESTHQPPELSANAALIENVVVNGPIDRLGLANNLFAIGEYPLALEMYQQTAGPELTSQQQFWVEYQTASCLRHLGNPAEASNRFRKLASQPEAGWLSEQAQRWVEHLENIRILEKALKDNSVEQWQKVIENVEAEVVEPPAESKETSTVSESSKNLEPAKDEHTH